jgi:hypothetical protein
MLSDIIICTTSIVCGFLCGMLFDSYMWRKMYKKDRYAVICLLEQIPHEI